MARGKNIKIFLILPVVVWILAITIFPLIFSLRLSLLDWHFGMPSKFFGMNNYLNCFVDKRMYNGLRVTVLFVVIAVVAEVGFGFLLALLFNQGIKGTKVLRAFITLPLFAAPIAVAYLGMLIFHVEYGPINFVLKKLAIVPVNWLATPLTAMAGILLLDIWQWTPFTFIVLLAGLQSLPDEPLEAAMIDGANPRQILRYIIIPMLAPVIVTTITFKMIYSFKVFDLPFGLTNGGPGNTTEVMAMYIHRQGLEFFNMGYAAALSFIFLIIVIAASTMLIKPMQNVYAKK